MALAVETIGDGPNQIWVLHGILGSGRNWRTFARRLSRPDRTVTLVDHRFHGRSGPAPGPHTIENCVHDLAHLAALRGAPDSLIGHSFGGKVALAYADRFELGVLAVLDAVPGIPIAAQTVENNEVLSVIEKLRLTPGPAPDRGTLQRGLSEKGLPDVLVRWLGTSLVRTEAGWDWVFSVDAVEEMIRSYFQTDLWHVLEEPTFTRGLVVRAVRSDRWEASDITRLGSLPESVAVATLDAGHWVHVDAPAALHAALEDILG